MTYNGYKNWETWNLVLWLQNEEGSYHAARAMVADAGDGAPDALREMIADANPLADAPSWYGDVLLAAIEAVDWQEVAAAFQDE